MAGIKKKTIVQGALILAAASVVTRLLGFVFRVYASRVVGAEGMGIYQLVMPFYGLAWSIACSGVTSTVTKMAAKEYAAKRYGDMGRLWKQATVLCVSVSLVMAALMFFGAPFIAGSIIKDGRAELALRILSAALPFMAAGSATRGYFLGLSQPVPPALAQVLEQTVRITVIFALAGVLVPLGLEYACAAAVMGVAAEEFVSCMFITASYRRFKKKNNLTEKPVTSAKTMFTALVATALPLTANRVSGSLLGTVENVLIPQRLQIFGLTAKEAVSEFGRITGMALPLIFFPSALLTALSVSLMPAVAEAAARKDYERVTNTISKAFMFTSIIGIGAAALFITLPGELGQVIYKQDIKSELFMFAFLCPLWYFNIIMSGALNGLGEEKFIFLSNLLGSLINIAAVWFLTPMYGMAAFVGGWAASLVIVTFLSVMKIRDSARIRFSVANNIIKPLLSAAAAGLVTSLLTRKVLTPLFGAGLGLVAALAVMLCLYCGFALLTGCVKISDVFVKHNSPALNKTASRDDIQE